VYQFDQSLLSARVSPLSDVATFNVSWSRCVTASTYDDGITRRANTRIVNSAETNDTNIRDLLSDSSLNESVETQRRRQSSAPISLLDVEEQEQMMGGATRPIAPPFSSSWRYFGLLRISHGDLLLGILIAALWVIVLLKLWSRRSKKRQQQHATTSV
jgi:hypothetical protein